MAVLKSPKNVKKKKKWISSYKISTLKVTQKLRIEKIDANFSSTHLSTFYNFL